MRWILWLFGLGKKERQYRRMEWRPTSDMETEQLPALRKRSMPELIKFWQENSPRGKETTRKLNELKQRQTDAIRIDELQF